jgi:hypothetical protein
MKPIANTLRNLATMLLPMAVVSLSPLAAAPVAQFADTNAPPMSAFIIPDNPKEGRDPFFPNSIRVYKDRPAAPGTTDVSSLHLQGISKSGNHVFVVINGETFAEGDESTVKTDTGKIDVICKKINANSVVVEAGGQILTLHYLSNQ